MRNQDFRAEQAKARGLGAAHAGTRNVSRQRLTALANVPLFIFFIGLTVSLRGGDYGRIHALFANPAVALVTALMLFSGIYHMMLGMRVIIEDYVHGSGLRAAALALNVFCSAALGAAALLALVKIMSGG